MKEFVSSEWLSRDFQSSKDFDSNRSTVFVSQIFWPSALLSNGQDTKRCFLVGWNLENFRCCIACMIPCQNVSLSILKDMLASENIVKITSKCSNTSNSVPTVIGEYLPDAEHTYIPTAGMQIADIWLTLTIDKNMRSTQPKLKLHTLYSCGCLYRTSCYLFRYQSLDANNIWNYSFTSLIEIESTKRNSLSKLKVIKDSNINRLGRSDGYYTLIQMNIAEAIHNILKNMIIYHNTIDENENHRKKSEDVIQEDVMNDDEDQYHHTNIFTPKNNVLRNFFMTIIYILCKLWLLLMIVSAKMIHSINSVLSMLPTNTTNDEEHTSILSHKTSYQSMKYTFIIHYLSIRTHTTSYIISKCLSLCQHWHLYTGKKRHHIWMKIHSHMISQILNICLGYMFSIIIWIYFNKILMLLHLFIIWFHDRVMIGILVWFDNSPIGVKLNPVLTLFMKKYISFILNYIIYLIDQYFIVIIYLFELLLLFSSVGFSAQLMFILDILSFLSIHITIFHYLFAIQIYFHCSWLLSLWFLFQGKKNNIFRNRVDSCAYDRHQLLIGTVLFAILFFLLPTFLSYYILFTLIHCGLDFIRFILWNVFIFWEEFPFVSVYLKLFYPQLVTVGVHLEVEIEDPSILSQSSVESIIQPINKHTIFDNITRRFRDVMYPLLRCILSILPSKRYSYPPANLHHVSTPPGYQRESISMHKSQSASTDHISQSVSSLSASTTIADMDDLFVVSSSDAEGEIGSRDVKLRDENLTNISYLNSFESDSEVEIEHQNRDRRANYGLNPSTVNNTLTTLTVKSSSDMTRKEMTSSHSKRELFLENTKSRHLQTQYKEISRDHSDENLLEKREEILYEQSEASPLRFRRSRKVDNEETAFEESGGSRLNLMKSFNGNNLFRSASQSQSGLDRNRRARLRPWSLPTQAGQTSSAIHFNLKRNPLTWTAIFDRYLIHFYRLTNRITLIAMARGIAFGSPAVGNTLLDVTVDSTLWAENDSEMRNISNPVYFKEDFQEDNSLDNKYDDMRDIDIFLELNKEIYKQLLMPSVNSEHIPLNNDNDVTCNSTRNSQILLFRLCLFYAFKFLITTIVTLVLIRSWIFLPSVSTMWLDAFASRDRLL